MALLEESEALLRVRGDPVERAKVLATRGAILKEMGEVSQGVQHLREALVLLRGTHRSYERATVMITLAQARTEQGAYREAETLEEQALTIYQTLGFPSGVTRCHTELAWIALEQGQDERTERLLDESLRQAGAAAAFEVAWALSLQGDLLTYRGLYDRAEAAYQDSLRLIEPMKMPWATAWVLHHAGVLAQQQGQLALARERLERALPLAQRATRRTHAAALTALGRVAAMEGRFDGAEHLLHDGLGLERSMGRPRGLAEALEGLAAVAMAQGETEQAVRMSAAAAGIRASIGAPLSPHEQVDFEHTLDAARDALGAATVDAIWADTQAVPWAQFVNEVLADG